MKWIYRITVFLAACVLLAAFVFYIYQNYEVVPVDFEETVVSKEIQSGQEQLGVIHAIAIDMDHDKTINHKTIESGDDSFFVIKASSKSLKDIPVASEGEKFYIFNGVGSIIRHVENFDGWINPTDSIFNELQLINLKRFDVEKRMMSLSNAGISALFFNPHYLDEVRQGIEPPLGEEIGYAVMSDSSQRIMKIVGIPSSFLR